MGRVSVVLLLLAFVVFGVKEPGVQGCICEDAHFQTRFCSFNAVMKVEVLEEEKIPEEHFFYWMKYKIRVLQVFRGSENLYDIQYIHTRSTASSCFAELPEKAQYLVSGTVDGNTLQMNMCNFHQPWNNLNMNQKINLDLYYPKYCECKINSCRKDLPSSGYLDCISTGQPIDDLAVCLKVSEESCRWFGYELKVTSLSTPMCAN